METHQRTLRDAVALGIGVMLVVAAHSAAASVVREQLPDGTAAILRNGRSLFLECRPPSGTPAKAYLGKYLAQPTAWSVYADKGTVAIPFSALKDSVRRELLLAVFPGDFVDEAGWHHRVHYADGGQGQETLWILSEWLTGKGTNADAVARANGLRETTLRRGQSVVFPAKFLLEVMRKPTPQRVPVEEPDPWADLDAAAEGLTYVTERGKTYAVYRLKQGEALYTAVVVRFTDLRENSSILKACKVVQQASGIKDVRAMEPGTPVRIPVELLSDRFKPHSSPERQEYEEVLQEARRLKGERVRTTKDLEGVVVVLDPGHGGDAQGAEDVRRGLYEDEINYDIVVRIMKILETQTRAKVYSTLRDKSQGFRETSKTRFRHDEDEVLLTTPNYDNGRAKTSVNLRWYLANSIYKKEVKAGTDPMKIIFTSVHCDALYDGRLRGAMVYIPGARLRRDREGGYSDPIYARFREVKEQPYFTATSAELRRDEAVSRNFAVVLLEELGKKRIKRHDAGDPIRSQIRQNGGVEYVPAVLRNNKIPTKVLVECANLTNSTDCARVADPKWRQWFAEAYVNALKRHFGD